MSKIIQIEQKMYGDYLCSCGCGQPLGHWSILHHDGLRCIGVGDESDEEGYEWRMFRRQCWDRLNLGYMKPEDVYDKYPVSPINDTQLESVPM